MQQNHDGLPQKAGFPQELINEAHGSWYDPSNPVAKYGGTCDPVLESLMEKEAESTDLVLVSGRSLGGLYADKLAMRTAERSRYPPTPESWRTAGARIETNNQSEEC